VQTDDLERERRRKAVAEVLGCQALEGVRPSSTHLAEMQRYADGLVSLEELLTELSAYGSALHGQQLTSMKAGSERSLPCLIRTARQAAG
jgi:hypothetical protein